MPEGSISRQAVASVLISLMLFACSSRRMLGVEEAELENGDAVHRAVTLDSDTVVFEGRELRPDSNTFTGQRYLIIEGNGAEYRDGLVTGLLVDGSELTLDVEDLQAVEVERFDLVKTSLYVGGTLVVVSGVLLILIHDAFKDTV
jgi:hypothetical protein